MKEIKGNAITYTLQNPEERILLHCCNSRGVMGSGVALEVKQRIPSAYKRYKESGHELATISFDVDYIVCNMVAQKDYGYDGERYVDYGYLAKCLSLVKEEVNAEFVIPKYMASDRAGGDWNIVIELCKGILGSDNITIVEYDGSK